jgi:hypothetical protein
VRIRIDWKYALNLELSDPGFDFSVLCEFRARLLGGHAEQLLFETMLDQFKTHGLRDPRVGANAPIRPMSWPPFAPSTVWNAWERRCATRWKL